MVPSIAVMPRDGEVCTSVLWQDEEGPGLGLLGIRRQEGFRFATDRGFGHLPRVIARIALFASGAVCSLNDVRFESNELWK